MSRSGFTIIPRWLLHRADLSKHAKLAYAVVASYTDETGEAWPSLATVARLGSMSVSSARRGLDQLEALGVVERTARRRPDGGQTSNLYRIRSVYPPVDNPVD